MAVDWAKELGIDLEELWREHPSHIDQIVMKQRLGRIAQEYWARERYLARLGDVIPAELPEEVPAPKERKPRKRAKLGRYEFTDKQLEIARRSLNGRKAV